jgi:hypothetical protein
VNTKSRARFRRARGRAAASASASPHARVRDTLRDLMASLSPRVRISGSWLPGLHSFRARPDQAPRRETYGLVAQVLETSSDYGRDTRKSARFLLATDSLIRTVRASARHVVETSGVCGPRRGGTIAPTRGDAVRSMHWYDHASGRRSSPALECGDPHPSK